MTNVTMTKSGLPRSTRKFIRLEKARIRAQFFDIKKQEEMIRELYGRFIKNKNEIKIPIDSQKIEASLNSNSDLPAKVLAQAGTLNSKQIPNTKTKNIKRIKKVKSK